MSGAALAAAPSMEPEATFSAWRCHLELPPHTQTRCLDSRCLHELVLEGFRHLDEPLRAPASPSPPLPVLYVAERESSRDSRGITRAGRPRTVLVQAPVVPDYQQLLMAQTISAVRILRTVHHYHRGQQISLRLVTNPTYRDGDTGQRQALIQDADCRAWLSRKMQANGVHITEADVTVGEPHALYSKTKPITVVTRYLTARGTVADPAALCHAQLTGIGRARAYGCGLLLTAPLEGS